MTTVEACALLRGVIPLDVRRWCHRGLVRYMREEVSARYLVWEQDVRAIAEYCGDRPATLTAVRRWRASTAPQ